MSQQSRTTTTDKHYDLVSVLYHALNGAQTYASYVQDAQREGDQELVQFFQQVYQEENARAERAKQILARRMTQVAAAQSYAGTNPNYPPQQQGFTH